MLLLIKIFLYVVKQYYIFYGSTAFVALGLLIVNVSRSRSRHMSLGRIPLYERVARRRGFYLTTHNINKWLTSMPSAGFKPAVPASERPQSHDLDLAATGIAVIKHIFIALILIMRTEEKRDCTCQTSHRDTFFKSYLKFIYILHKK